MSRHVPFVWSVARDVALWAFTMYVVTAAAMSLVRAA